MSYANLPIIRSNGKYVKDLSHKKNRRNVRAPKSARRRYTNATVTDIPNNAHQVANINIITYLPEVDPTNYNPFYYTHGTVYGVFNDGPAFVQTFQLQTPQGRARFRQALHRFNTGGGTLSSRNQQLHDDIILAITVDEDNWEQG